MSYADDAAVFILHNYFALNASVIPVVIDIC